MKSMRRMLNNKKVVTLLISILFLLVIFFAIKVWGDKTKLFQTENQIKDDLITSIEHIEAIESVPNIPSRIIFENIPDDSFVPSKTGKMLRINLETMTLLQYENSELINSMKLVAKGAPGSIWEMPGGRFPIDEKEEDYFSKQAGVWLPFSMHLFGNFMIHGEPHDANGKKVKTTKGAIRISNEDALSIFSWIDSETIVSVYSKSKGLDISENESSTYITKNGKQKPRVSAESYIVGDLETGEILLEKNADTAVPIASISKLMTALVSLETINQFDTTTISKEAVGTYGTSGLRPGEKIEVRSLLYPLLLSSSNDASEAIAEHAGRENFLASMNTYAKNIGMENTNFNDPSGLSAQNTSSARDLFKLSSYILEHKPFLYAITTKRSFAIKGHAWGNISQYLDNRDYRGGKSGRTSEAKLANVTTFDVAVGEFATRRIAIIVLRSDDRVTDTNRLLAYVKQALIGHTENFTIVHNEKTATLGFVGDIMLDRGVKHSVKKNFGGDYSALFENIDVLQNTDILFANLEGPASDKGSDLGNLYSFRMPIDVPDLLKGAGFDILSFANNHVGDWGREAFDDTLERLENAGLQFTGAGKNKEEAEKVKIIEVNGLKVGYVAFSDVGPNHLEAGSESSGILLASDPRLKEIIQNAKKEADVVVVSFHFGNEYVPASDRQKLLARLAIDAGATIVAGHHPHVAQEVETYKGGLIIYSLGNFIFDQYFSKPTMEGLGVIVSLEGENIVRYDRYKIPLDKRYQPQKPVLIK